MLNFTKNETEENPINILSFKEGEDFYIVRGIAHPCIIPTGDGKCFKMNAEDITILKNGVEETEIDAYAFLDKAAIEYLNAARYLTQSCEELEYLYERMRAEKIDVPNVPREDKYYIGANGCIMELMFVSGSFLAYSHEQESFAIVDSYTEAVVTDDKSSFAEHLIRVLENPENTVGYYHEEKLAVFLSAYDVKVNCKGLEAFFQEKTEEMDEREP